MWTETYGQIVDRLIISRLKAWHYTQDDNKEAAKLAQDQCQELSAALTRYQDDCLSKRLIPRVTRHLRYHDHNQVEAWRGGKQATKNAPDTIAFCVNELVDTHCDYWLTQSRIQTLKKLIDATKHESEKNEFCIELVHLQRQHIDLDNQYRNELVQKIDELFAHRIEGINE
jgi:hypothetical protein